MAGQQVFGESFATLIYTGRKSGREIVLPVKYRRQGSDLVVGVRAPDAKKLWRNFTGVGAGVSVRIGASTSPGHATAVRDDEGAVSVRILCCADGCLPMGVERIVPNLPVTDVGRANALFADLVGL